MEDMTPLQYFPNAPNSQGYVSVGSIIEMWKARFEYLYSEDDESQENSGFIFPLVLHPDTSGMAHVIGMVDKMIAYLKGWGTEVEFVRYEDCAREWRQRQKI